MVSNPGLFFLNLLNLKNNGFIMIEKIGTEEAKWLSKPCGEMIECLERMLRNNPPSLTVAEVGVGYGATSVEIVKRLRNQDAFYFYSFQDEVDELFEDLRKQEYCQCRLVPLGNSHTVYDSFCWNLGKQVIDPKDKGGIFDLVYLDGAHSFLFSGLACALLKQLVRDGGYLAFDDLHWSYGHSHDRAPQVEPEILEQFTQEQVDTFQIQMVVDAFMNNDRQWVCRKKTERRAVYQKKPERKMSSLLSFFRPGKSRM